MNLMFRSLGRSRAEFTEMCVVDAVILSYIKITARFPCCKFNHEYLHTRVGSISGCNVGRCFNHQFQRNALRIWCNIWKIAQIRHTAY